MCDTTPLLSTLATTRVGVKTGRDRLTVVALHRGLDSIARYVTAPDAMRQGTLVFREVCPGGIIDRVCAHNTGTLPVLIAEGSTLVGGRQNRVATLSILVPPGEEISTPVRCVEHGRWSLPITSHCTGPHADHLLRRALHSPDRNDSSVPSEREQRNVWSHVSHSLQSTHTSSATQAYHDLFDTLGAPQDPCRHFACPKDATGIAVLIDGSVAALDMFDQTNTLSSLWPALMDGYMVGARLCSQSVVEEEDVHCFIQHCADATMSADAGPGWGTHMRLASSNVVGSALVWNNVMIHLSLFPAPALTSGSESVSLKMKRRSWWQFWRRGCYAAGFWRDGAWPFRKDKSP